ncbi:PadR family transcriptional regulator [Microcella alkalica]|uniref:DNA-binding PadR family transcriptional regulator n=1 Tax=Microcella alkalica TaxID=355930 RepID=A0A839E9D6_9MICO|nr:PadR family transcriptional regulator [Microcella alkalica]MBA8848380.1 DNA-binding PadR family transcriptional regulator [Microcella alkalica]
MAFGVVTADALLSGLHDDASISTVRGDIVVDGVVGDLRLQNVSGEISVRGHHGDVTARTVGGDVRAATSPCASTRAPPRSTRSAPSSARCSSTTRAPRASRAVLEPLRRARRLVHRGARERHRRRRLGRAHRARRGGRLVTPAVFGHGHLRLYLLHVLAVQPMHGYEIIQALSDRFGGTYVPSAGTVYPRLGKLEADGLVSRLPDGRRTTYALTPERRAELAARSAELDEIEAGVGDSVRRLADEVRASVGEAMTSLRAELAAATREARDEARATGRRVDENVSVVRGEGRERLHRADRR